MLGIPEELIEAAKMDGAKHGYIFFRLVVPLSTSVLATAFILSFISSWNDFFNPLVYLSSISNYTIPLGITTFNSSHSNMKAWTSAASIVALMPIFIIFLSGQRYILDSVATSGLKG
jgi:multiple sugar transport system permease protein